jgi:hypothetical protein
LPNNINYELIIPFRFFGYNEQTRFLKKVILLLIIFTEKQIMKRLILFFAFSSQFLVYSQSNAPIVYVNGDFYLGSAYKGNYTDPESALSDVKTNQTYQLYSLNGFIATSLGEAPYSMAEPCPDVFVLKLDYNVPDSIEVVGIGGNWNAYPEKLKIESTEQQNYLDITSAILKEKGFTSPEVELDWVIRTDLENDGIDEVLICTSHFDEDLGTSAVKGDYSMVFLRKIIDGKVENIMIEGDFHPENNESGLDVQYNIVGILDVDNDGNYEIIISEKYYEGYSFSVYGLKGNKVELLLSIGCGV